jgi:hypothetical protein
MRSGATTERAEAAAAEHLPAKPVWFAEENASLEKLSRFFGEAVTTPDQDPMQARRAN